MLILNTLPAANGSRNMKARLEPLSRSIWKQKNKIQTKKGDKKRFKKEWGYIQALSVSNDDLKNCIKQMHSFTRGLKCDKNYKWVYLILWKVS